MCSEVKPGHMISKDADLVFYLSVTLDYDVAIDFRVNSTSLVNAIQKVQRHHDLIKTHVVRYPTFIRLSATIQLI